MNNILNYIDIILLGVLLLFLLLYFKRLLGKKIGYQKQEQETIQSTTYAKPTVANGNTKIVDNSEVSDYKYPIGSLMQKIEIIEAHDSLFSSKSFITSSKKAFEMIVKAFNAGDMAEVKDFLSTKVYNAFSSSVEARDEHKKVINVDIKQFVSSEIIDVKIDDNFDAFISVKYITLQARGYGEQTKDIQLSETWVFSKNIKENTSIWKLVKTY